MTSGITHNLDNLNLIIKKLKESSEEIGAIAIFVGTVRGYRGEEKVVKLTYEAYNTLAEEKIKEIIEETKIKFALKDAIIQHRVGSIEVGEEIMYVLTASEHRTKALQALSEIVERIKLEIPIWKKEITENRTYWVENSEDTLKNQSP